MRKSVLLAAVFAVSGHLSTWALPSRADEATASATSANKVGLIDMAHIFKNYKKLDGMREDLKSELAAGDAKARQMISQLKAMDDQLKQMKPGSAGYAEKEKQLLQLNADFEAFRKGVQRDLVRKESQMYKSVYLEVSEAVQKYAHHYKYSIILRYGREDVANADDPQAVLNSMNRQVVYNREEDDITTPVLQFLNRNYEKTLSDATPAPTKSAIRPVSGTK